MALGRVAVLQLILACAAARPFTEPRPQSPQRQKGSEDPTAACNGSACCGMARYPVGGRGAVATRFAATFDVPGLPDAAVDGSMTDYVYFNVFFDGGGPSGKMNQFVPQLMLGNPLCGSTGPPAFKPLWDCHATTYVFGAQYFFEIFNATANKTEAHAATGPRFNASPGEVLYTTFDLDAASWAWTLEMGVVGDDARTSTVVADTPYMGLLQSETDSWGEEAFSTVFVNSCWELYGMRDRSHYPSSGSTYEMRVSRPPKSTWPWFVDWIEDETPDCPGAPKSAIEEDHNDTDQTITWKLYWD